MVHAMRCVHGSMHTHLTSESCGLPASPARCAADLCVLLRAGHLLEAMAWRRMCERRCALAATSARGQPLCDGLAVADGHLRGGLGAAVRARVRCILPATVKLQERLTSAKIQSGLKTKSQDRASRWSCGVALKV